VHEFFVPKSSVKGDIAKIEKDDFHHLVNVLRAKVGERFLIVVDRGEKYVAKLIEISEKSAKLKLEEKLSESFETKANIYLAQSIPKGKKFEEVLRVGTELGVKGFYPLITERTEIKIKDEKIERFKKIVKEEAQLSKRDIIPEIFKPIKFEDFISLNIKSKNKLIFWELEDKNSIEDFNINEDEDVYIVVGNEGGFSLKEIDMAKNNGFVSLSLGKRILRTEVAPIVILTIVLYKLHEFKR